MSIAKEKAKELIDKMAFEVCKTDAKQCALIAVDEKINLFKQIILDFHLDENEKALNIYRELKEVKQEIQKLL